MAKSKYEYVKQFEEDPALLPECYIVCRIDGRSFHRFTLDHAFLKPNDIRALSLMNRCAEEVCKTFSDIIIAIGMSDEFSFVFKRNTSIFCRRSQKINSSIVSQFSASYVFYWPLYMPDTPLQYVPSFDSRLVLYPTDRSLRDYLSWRQVDCHINNLYNTCFWSLVSSGQSERETAQYLKDTNSAQKNELLFTRFGINYNSLEPMFRKGSIVIRENVSEEHFAPDGRCFTKLRSQIRTIHEDLIGDVFWSTYPCLEPKFEQQVLSSSSAKPGILNESDC